MFLNDLLPKQDTVIVSLTHKEEKLLNEDGSPMTIEAFLPHTKQYKEAMHARVDNSIEKERKEEHFTASELEEIGLDFMVKTTKDWSVTFAEGDTPKFSYKKAKEFYSKFPSFAKQVRDEVESSQVFI